MQYLFAFGISALVFILHMFSGSTLKTIYTEDNSFFMESYTLIGTEYYYTICFYYCRQEMFLPDQLPQKKEIDFQKQPYFPFY